jgi:hypothetical protein
MGEDQGEDYMIRYSDHSVRHARARQYLHSVIAHDVNASSTISTRCASSPEIH